MANSMDLKNPPQTPNVDELLRNIGSDDDPVRKMAAFKLQTLINDPSFAEHFVQNGGLPKLRLLVLESSGNTLAYGLASFARLLDVDQGWEGVDDAVIEKVVELVVCQPLVNILRGAMAILVSIVSKPHSPDRSSSSSRTPSHPGGFQALKPAIAIYPQFLEMLVSRLSSADHALCANALQLINSLMRDAITNDNETEWPKFIKRIQDLGVIKAVYVLMKSSALQDLAHPLLEFQALTKILLRRWRDVPVDLVKPEHRRTIKAIHLASNPEKTEYETKNGDTRPKHNPNKWRRLGFTTETPEPDFEAMGFLGMMDLSDYVRKHQDEFQHLLVEQAVGPENSRCPIARASLMLTAILFEHFEVDKQEQEDSKSYLALESRTNYERVFKPLLLHWSRLHVAGLHAFFRLWKSTGAENDDFPKIVELVRILIESVVGGADRTKGVEEIESELAAFGYARLRELQMELLELSYEDVWGPHLRGAREELQAEALQFVREQRIRCLLHGAWFPNEQDERDQEMGGRVRDGSMSSGQRTIRNYRFVRLSDDRKYLHWGDFDQLEDQDPTLADLPDNIDLAIVSSVVSNVTTNDQASIRSESTLKDLQANKLTTTKITIHGYVPKNKPRGHSRGNSRASNNSTSKASSHNTQQEVVLLTFQPTSQVGAAEWLDGLLMLLNQQPITAETNKLISVVSEYGLKIRLLNVRFNDEEGLISNAEGDGPEIPSREGLDEDYHYEI